MFNFFKKTKVTTLKRKCPCCGYYTLNPKAIGVYEICPVCFWEDDPFQLKDADLTGMANHVSLNKAKENYKTFGAVEERLIEYVRPPKEDELSGIDN